MPEYTAWTPTVRCWSTISVNKRICSVPSRLIGHPGADGQYADVVEVHYRGRLIETMPRPRGEKTAGIDCRHLIWC